MCGKTLITKQAGPAGKQDNRIYIETGANIDSELYLSILVDRESGQTLLVASTEGGRDIDTVAHDTPENIHTIGKAASKGVTDADANKIAAALQLTGTARDPVKGTEFIDIFRNASWRSGYPFYQHGW
jgi:succinyl-CoA synthetase beta subunit